MIISVVVPVYNTELYLEQCINSLISQTMAQSLEVVLVDDGSTDKSGIICDSYAERYDFIKVIHQPNSGVSSARNTGLKVMSGDYVLFLDSDDWLEPNAIAILINVIEFYKCDSVFYGVYKNTPKKQTVISFPYENIYYEDIKENIYAASLGYVPSSNSNNKFGWMSRKVFRSECIKNIFFDENMYVGEDTHFYSNVMRNVDTLVFVPQPLYHYQMCSDSITHKRNPYMLDYCKQFAQKEHLLLEENCWNDTTKQALYLHSTILINLCLSTMCDGLSLRNQKQLVLDIISDKYISEALDNVNKMLLSKRSAIMIGMLRHGAVVPYVMLYKIYTLLIA